MATTTRTVSRQWMTAGEARAAVERVRERLERARRARERGNREARGYLVECRADLLDLSEREGWKALGYASWPDCVLGEFDASRTAVYAERRCAELEAELSQFGILRPVQGSHLEKLKPLPGPESRRRAFDGATQRAASEGRPRTARDVEDAADAELERIRNAALDDLPAERKAWALRSESDRLEGAAAARARSRYRSDTDRRLEAADRLFGKLQRVLRQLADVEPRCAGPAVTVGKAEVRFAGGRAKFAEAWEMLDSARDEMKPGSGRRKKVA